MTARQHRLNIRNQQIRNEFDRIVEKNPQWRIDACIAEVAGKWFLSERTIEAILRNEGCYAEKII